MVCCGLKSELLYCSCAEVGRRLSRLMPRRCIERRWVLVLGIEGGSAVGYGSIVDCVRRWRRCCRRFVVGLLDSIFIVG